MGASGWSYFTPYRTFTNQALHELRKRVFVNREYQNPFGAGADEDMIAAMEPILSQFPPEERARKMKEFKAVSIVTLAMQRMHIGSLKPEEMMKLMGMADQFTHGSLPDDELDAAFEAFEARVNQLLGQADARPKPDSIQALVEKCAENGTHSILDIDHISVEPEFGAASPMPDEMIEEIYGSLEPTHEDVANASNGDDSLDRWQAWYVVVFKDGRPHELFFTGCSGD